MVKRFIFAAVFLIMLCAFAGSVQAREGVVSLCYHDIGNGTNNNPWTVTKKNLEAHFAYLNANGYHPISLDQYMEANKHGAPLPDKPVLLTFDDGYLSFYTEVFPLLKQYNYPAVLSVVTSWMNYTPPGVGRLVNWAQMKEMEATGLVSIASHTHDLHHAVTANSFHDTAYAAATLTYRNGRYENFDAYKTRIAADLKLTQATFERELGHKTAVLTWPYGEFTQAAVDIAQNEGFEVLLALGGGVNPVDKKSMLEVRRGIIYNNPAQAQFAKFLQAGGQDGNPVRAAQLDIDLIYDPDNPRQTDINLNLAIERFFRSGINTVFLQACPDPKGDGNIESVYFYTTAAPMRADVFDHIARKLENQGFIVYAWMPTLSAQWLTEGHPEDAVVAYDRKNQGWYRRATPFSKNVQDRLQAMFRDLAAHSYIHGILFQDDLYLNDFEDFSPAAKQVFREKFGRELTPEILQNPKVRDEWTRVKTDALTDLTRSLMQTVRQYKPQALSARNIYAEPVMNPGAQEWYAQDYQQYLGTYDYTVIMAYPFLEKQGRQSVKWMSELADTALRDPAAANKVIFKIQTYDWDKNRWIADKELLAEIKTLRAKGAIHFGYYPENVFDENTGLLPLGNTY